MFRRTQDPELRALDFAYWAFTICGQASQPVQLSKTLVTQMFSPTTPTSKLVGLGSSPFARRYLGNRFFFLFLWVLRCFSSPRLPLLEYVFPKQQSSTKMIGFPHSEISGSKLTYSSPKHIGVSPVLHRLLVPRHSPCALHNLTLLSLRDNG